MPAYNFEVLEQGQKIIFFDGDCAMCSRFVRFCLKRDTRQRLRYAPIDGATWNTLIEKVAPGERETIHVLTDERHLVRTSAVIEILGEIGGWWRMTAAMLWIIPRPIRNIGYRFIAWNRKRVSKITGTCPLPDPDEQACILP